MLERRRSDPAAQLPQCRRRSRPRCLLAHCSRTTGARAAGDGFGAVCAAACPRSPRASPAVCARQAVGWRRAWERIGLGGMADGALEPRGCLPTQRTAAWGRVHAACCCTYCCAACCSQRSVLCALHRAATRARPWHRDELRGKEVLNVVHNHRLPTPPTGSPAPPLTRSPCSAGARCSPPPSCCGTNSVSTPPRPSLPKPMPASR